MRHEVERDFPWITHRDIDDDGNIVYEEHRKMTDEDLAEDRLRETITKIIDSAEPAYDPINHPEHYTVGIETYKYITSWNMEFPAGNVIKYVTRAPWKGKYLSDLKKAKWYLDQMISKEELLVAEDERAD